MFDRKELVENLITTSSWDLIIIGGGATGLGIALDSSSRGFKTLLLEQADFAKGTSSRSTKLVHGGVRYLAQGHIDLVREALFERGLMLKNASHLVRKQSFIIPNYTWWDHLFYLIGLKIYDLLARKLSFGRSIRISRKKTLSRLQNIKGDKLKGGVLYFDGQFDDSRLAINLAQTAIENGATVLNYFRVNTLLKDDDGLLTGVFAQDMEGNAEYALKGKVIVNATGVFADDILKMDDISKKKSIRPSQGVHLVLDKSFHPGEDAIMIPKTPDGRVLFLVPWRNRVLVGTTDTPINEESLEPKALNSEVDFILDTANNFLSNNATRKDVLSVFAGLRPLAAPKDNSETSKEISRSHKIMVSESGLISIVGGKWTTYRKMAQDTVEKAIQFGKLPRRTCKTKDLPIHGSIGLRERKDHLSFYGSDSEGIHTLIDLYPELQRKVHPRLEFSEAEVVWAIRSEMARTVEDVLARRVRALFLDARAAVEAAPKVAEIIARELHKDEDWIDEQLKDFSELARHYMIQVNTGMH